MDDFEDKEVVCVDCNQPFTLEAGEQKFFADKGLSTPKRCKPCRQKKRESNERRDRNDGPKRTRSH